MNLASFFRFRLLSFFLIVAVIAAGLAFCVRAYNFAASKVDHAVTGIVMDKSIPLESSQYHYDFGSHGSHTRGMFCIWIRRCRFSIYKEPDHQHKLPGRLQMIDDRPYFQGRPVSSAGLLLLIDENDVAHSFPLNYNGQVQLMVEDMSKNYHDTRKCKLCSDFPFVDSLFNQLTNEVEAK